MSIKAPPEPRKRPQQNRSKETVRAIREACARIVHKEGPEAVTTARIAEVAGVNIASLYQYFPNKHAILADFYDAESSAFAAMAAQRFRLLDRLSKESLEKTLAAIIDLELQQILALSRLHPGFFAQYRGNFDIHDKVNELTQSQHNPSWEQWFPQFLNAHASRLRAADIDLLSEVAYRALQGALQTISLERVKALGSEALKTELLYLLLSYLLAEPPTVDDCRAFFGALDKP